MIDGDNDDDLDDDDDVIVQGGVLWYFVASNEAQWLNNIDFEEFFQYSPKP